MSKLFSFKAGKLRAHVRYDYNVIYDVIHVKGGEIVTPQAKGKV